MRSNTLDASRRAYLGITRGVIMASDDSKFMQTIDARGKSGELLQGIERPQLYGHHSVPVDPDENGAKGAEVVVGFVDGNRAHPIVLAEGDRRYGAKNWQQGESGLWHYKGATSKLTTEGWKHDAGPDKQPHVVTVGNAVVTVADGKISCQVGGAGGPAVVIKADFAYIGGDPDEGGTFGFIQTDAGISTRAKAKV